MSGDISYFQFDSRLLRTNPGFLSELATFYCSIWRFDPNFAEYTKCSNCKRYYSYTFSVTERNTCCPDCGVDLVPAWVESKVEKTIYNLAELKKDFFGAVAYDNMKKKIIGFVWGYNRPFSEVEEPEIMAVVQNSTGRVPYFNEIATDPAYRQDGIGSQLCRMLVEWMRKSFPHIPGYLHTHENSPARRLFEKAGYSFLCFDGALLDGRIYMSIDKCANFTPEKL